MIAAGAIGAAAIALFLILGQATFAGFLNPAAQSNANSTALVARDLGIVVKNITVSRQDNNSANVFIVFGLSNPNSSTALLENLHYSLSVGGNQMTSGDTGEPLEGFLASQATAVPIVPMGSVAIKDNQISTRNNVTGSSWDSMVQGTAKYAIEGWYAVRTTSSLQTNYQQKNFNMTFPAG